MAQPSDTIPFENNTTKSANVDTVVKVKEQDVKKKVILMVKDSTKYSKRFLNGLLELGLGSKFELTDNQIITDDHYKNKFSQILPLNKEITFTGTKNGFKYWLAVTRVNYTTINYTFRLNENEKEIVSEQGQADLSPGFMLGVSTSQDDYGNVYGCNDYYPVDEKCIYSISVGINKNILNANVSGCGDYLKLGSCPTLK